MSGQVTVNFDNDRALASLNTLQGLGYGFDAILLVRMDDQRRMLLLKDGSYRAVEKIELKDPR